MTGDKGVSLDQIKDWESLVCYHNLLDGTYTMVFEEKQRRLNQREAEYSRMYNVDFDPNQRPNIFLGED